MPQQAPILPQTLHEKMNAGYARRVTGGGGGAVISSSTDTTIVTEQVTASVIFTFPVALSGLRACDGVDLIERELVVCNGQADATENGIWYASAGAWVRHSQPIYGGLTVSINKGVQYGDTFWQVSQPDGKVEIGVDSVRFEQIGATDGKDAAGKFGFLMKMLGAMKKDILCKLTPYEVVCHAQDIPTAFSVPDNTLTIIPFTTLVYTPSTGSYSAPTGFTVERDGYYDVDAAFQNYSLTTPVVRVFMNIGTSGITYQVDDVIMGTEIMRLQGSMKIWCNAGDSIRVYLSHQAGVGILFNTLAHPGATGYVSISYAGSYKAATH